MGNTNNNTHTDARLEEWRKQYTEQVAKVEQLTTDKSNADARLAQIEIDWQNGNDTASAEDHAIAAADVKRTTALLAAAESRLKTLDRARPVPLVLAQALSETVADLLGEPVTVGRSDSGSGAVLVPSGTLGASSGVLSGVVTLYRDSSPFSAGIDADRLSEALRAAGVFGKVEPLKRGEREGAQIKVSAYAIEGLPVVPNEPNREAIHALAESSLKIAEGRLLMRDIPVSLARGDRGNVSFELAMRHQIITDEQGRKIRETVVSAMPRLAGGYVDGAEVSRYTSMVLDGAAYALETEDKGKPLPYMGTIVETRRGGFTMHALLDAQGVK